MGRDSHAATQQRRPRASESPSRSGVHVGSPRPGGLLRHPALDWSGHGARLGSRVGCVGRYDPAAAPHMRVDMRSGAFNGRRSARGMALQVDDAAVTSD